MAKPALTGSRIRARRIDSGIKQAALARDCDISASYLNLIEHNRRRIGGALLNKIARALDVEAVSLSEGAESALMRALETAAARHPEIVPEVGRGEEFAGRFPGWARLLERQMQESERLQRALDVLNDRLTFDPHLAASMHDVLSTVTSIRSTSAILADGEAVEPEWQDRFHRNLYEDSQRLAQSAEELVSYLDRSADAEQPLSLPQDDLESWLEGQGWSVAALEDDPSIEIEALMAESAPVSIAARALALKYLTRYRDDARLLSASAIRLAIESVGESPLALADHLRVALPCVLRRLATLPDSDFKAGVAPGLVACDGSGTLTFRKPVAGFDLPRYGAACPLWPMFQAMQRTGAPLHAVLLKDGRDQRRFAATAIATQSFPSGYGGPPVVEALMLLQPVPDDEGPVDVAVGTSCRICTVNDCPARREPTLLTLANPEHPIGL